MAPYVDAFAPMVYWECVDPGSDATQDIARLQTLRPVHVIGEAFELRRGPAAGAVSPSGGRDLPSSWAPAIDAGALGGSFWVVAGGDAGGVGRR